MPLDVSREFHYFSYQVWAFIRLQQCLSAGGGIYYGYDSAGRLNVIKDNEQHTLSTYEYHESNPN